MPDSLVDDPSQAPRLLLLGASGAIGHAIQEKFMRQGWHVVATGRTRAEAVPEKNIRWIQLDPFDDHCDWGALDSQAPYAAVCWAQGANVNDNAYDVDVDTHMNLYRANCLFIVITLQKLLQRGLLSKPARLCVISSIWQNIARQNKYSYCITKAALQGLVLSAAADLAVDGHLINAVLPGALDTPMTRQNLSSQQIDVFASATQFNRMPQLGDVSNMVYYLCSPDNTGVTGQFIASDLGFSHVRIL